MSIRLAGIIVLAALLTTPASAMTFRSVTTADGRTLIIAEKAIGPGDGARFRNFMDWQRRGAAPFALSVDSPGGSVVEATEIAEAVQARGLPVAVLGAHTCASACFLIFAAAPARMVGPNALVGVHSASLNGEETMGSLAVTMLMAREAKALHVPPAVIGKMVATAADDMAWLTVSDLHDMGADLVDDDQGRTLLAAAESTAPSSSPPPAVPPLASLGMPLAKPSSLEQRASGFVREYFATWSADNDTANGFVNRAYAPTVDFYGKPVARGVILTMKQAYTARWPVRTYQPRFSSIQSSCDPVTRICSVAGTVDWDCKSPPRSAQSAGASSFALRVDLSGSQGLILAEGGSVVARAASSQAR